MSLRTAVVLFTRDLRVHDNPTLSAACAAAEHVVPMFVLDPKVPSSPHRDRFLAQSLADLRESLRARGGDLVVRHGDPVEQAVRMAKATDAFGIGMAADVSAYAARREHRMERACAQERLALKVFESVTAVPPGAVRPSTGGDHYRVFTPYYRAWLQFGHRKEITAPREIALPHNLDPGGLPETPDTHLMPGGETAARQRLQSWRRYAEDYKDLHNDLAQDKTSHLSAYLHFGCLSPISLLARVNDSEEFRRQVCWRDFYHQVLHGFPALPHTAYRQGVHEEWEDDEQAMEAWREGETGVPIVDAGMRQLKKEGFMHNRARLITASYLTKQLKLDWRAGAAWYAHLLLDADVANNYGNWQWVAGTGNDTKPYRRFNPFRQAERYDPDGEYVRRYLQT